VGGGGPASVVMTVPTVAVQATSTLKTIIRPNLLGPEESRIDAPPLKEFDDPKGGQLNWEVSNSAEDRASTSALCGGVYPGRVCCLTEIHGRDPGSCRARPSIATRPPERLKSRAAVDAGSARGLIELGGGAGLLRRLGGKTGRGLPRQRSAPLDLPVYPEVPYAFFGFHHRPRGPGLPPTRRSVSSGLPYSAGWGEPQVKGLPTDGSRAKSFSPPGNLLPVPGKG
jgi:hypothetical protein